MERALLWLLCPPGLSASSTPGSSTKDKTHPKSLGDDLNAIAQQCERAGPSPEWISSPASLPWGWICSPVPARPLRAGGATAAGLHFFLQLSLRNPLPEQQKELWRVLGWIFLLEQSTAWAVEPIQPNSLGIGAGLGTAWGGGSVLAHGRGYSGIIFKLLPTQATLGFHGK